MAANGVNLDALIPREDFATPTSPAKGTPSDKISLAQLKDDFFVFSLRKPDFQRETSNWTADKIVDLIAAFLDGELIPAVILWRAGQFVFVIDGAHRLSAILAWVYDDYGDRSRSSEFFQGQIPEEQKKLAEATRKLVNERVGTYASYIDANRTEHVPDKIKDRIGMMNSNSFIAQWVPALDAAGAEKAFFKINEAPTPVDPFEKRILGARSSALAIATRAVNRGGTGHPYWERFATPVQERIVEAGKAIYSALYEPPMGGLPIKTSDVPVGGRGYNSLPFVFEFLSLANGIGTKDSLPGDPDGEQTVTILREARRRLELITTDRPGSLGLHPLVYFYSRGGAFQPIAFLAIMQFVESLVVHGKLDAFTGCRRRFEDFLLSHKGAFTRISKDQGAGRRSLPALQIFLMSILDGLCDGKDDEAIVADMARDDRFAFMAVPPPIRRQEGDTGGRFSRSVKTAAFVSALTQSGARCGICGGLLHRNSMTVDHVRRLRDGGDARPDNAQMAHPYCNSGYKA